VAYFGRISPCRGLIYFAGDEGLVRVLFVIENRIDTRVAWRGTKVFLSAQRDDSVSL